MKIEENVPLAPLTTFGIGGLARFFVRVQTIEELKEALSFAQDKQLALLVLGGGSNVLISDSGFDGLVIKIELAGITVEEGSEQEGDQQGDKHKKILIAGAGESWDALVARSVEENLWGLENLSGIPGTVGGAVAGNIGAYGQALSQTLEWVELYDRTKGEVCRWKNEACHFGYRDSFFKQNNGRYIILRGAFKLSNEPRPELSYKDLKETFPSGESLDVQAIREAILTIRRGKFPDLSVEGSAGSFFKNPIVSSEEATVLQAKYPSMPLFSMPEVDGIKIPLAWLLDHVLQIKGMSMGGARLFEKQPLVIVSKKRGSASDVVALHALVKDKVHDACKIDIEPEVKIIS